MLCHPQQSLAFFIKGMIAFSNHSLIVLKASVFKMCVVLQGKDLGESLLPVCDAARKQQNSACYSRLGHSWLFL